MSAPHPRIVIAGGGVAALEAALALRALLGRAAAIDLVAPADELEYRPLAVGEPFGLAAARRVPLADVERSHGVRHVRDRLQRIDVRRRRATTAAGTGLDYDALIVAVGAQPRRWLRGALTFGGSGDVARYAELLEDVRAGRTQRLVFAAPPAPSWPLPLYELALMTSAWAADRGVIGLELEVVVPDAEPLAIFGPAAARAIRDLLGDRGIRLRHGRAVITLERGVAILDDGTRVPADAVVTLPVLEGRPPGGLPFDRDRFLPVGPDGAVAGAPGVWAIGDATAGPVKHGGLATHQADVAAAAVAAALGADVAPPAGGPVLRAILLTGVVPAYLSAAFGDPGPSSTVGFSAVWSPPAKVAGRHLTPYLAHAGVPAALAPDRDARVRELLVALARRDAADGDEASAREWLRVLETLEGAVPARA